MEFDAVKDYFEFLYQGDPSDPASGLKRLEVPLVSAHMLRELKRSCPKGLAVVTGRPRRDAAEAIALHGWEGIFDAVVCMEDGPPKPSPAPVLKAMRALKLDAEADSVVFLGDTVDDVVAGLRAGVSPLGVLPPNSGAPLAATLQAAGSAGVLAAGLWQLQHWLKPAESHDAQSGRVGRSERKTKETSIEAAVSIDGTGRAEVDTGVGFLDHMVSALAKHSRMDITLKCKVCLLF